MTGQRTDLLEETLALLTAITPFQSVSGNLSQQRTLAAWLEQWLQTHLNAQVVYPVSRQLQLDRPPLVHVRIDIGARTSLTLYNMYDVMPADAEGWQSDPFNGVITRRADKGDVFVARGAENNKGPLAGMLAVVRQLWRSGRLRVNLDILLEGEEETGSGHLRRYLARQPCPVAASQAVLFPSLCEYGGGPPRIYLGFTGLTSARLQVNGGDWGGPQAAVHASNAAWIANPAWRLTQALGRIAPAEQNGVLLTCQPDDDAQALLTPLASRFVVADELRFRRSARLAIEGDTLHCLNHLLGSAVLNIAEIHTLPAGGRGVIPYAASAELALRVPPHLDPQTLLHDIRYALSRPELDGVALHIADSYPGCRFGMQDAGVAELLHSYRRQQAEPDIWPWAPGCAPAYAFAPIAPAFLIGGLGEGGNAHGIDEFATLRGLTRFTQSLVDWLGAFYDPPRTAGEHTENRNDV
ncbi:M20/M25/M40 family metallo-hydrolase [Musicola keenii]|uniref:M20/M25/M40 family metallo-hydrolase n=1 Tax=Musicola keenii TaxID=2884250 RepID=UPI00177F568C